jgi:hypothetical protein
MEANPEQLKQETNKTRSVDVRYLRMVTGYTRLENIKNEEIRN